MFAISKTLSIKVFTSDSVPSNSTINNISTSLGYPALAKLSVAIINGLSIISIPAGIMPALIMSATELPASSLVSKPIRTARTDCGFFKILTVISVITPNNPSEPVTTPNKS